MIPRKEKVIEKIERNGKGGDPESTTIKKSNESKRTIEDCGGTTSGTLDRTKEGARTKKRV